MSLADYLKSVREKQEADQSSPQELLEALAANTGNTADLTGKRGAEAEKQTRSVVGGIGSLKDSVKSGIRATVTSFQRISELNQGSAKQTNVHLAEIAKQLKLMTELNKTLVKQTAPPPNSKDDTYSKRDGQSGTGEKKLSHVAKARQAFQNAKSSIVDDVMDAREAWKDFKDWKQGRKAAKEAAKIGPQKPPGLGKAGRFGRVGRALGSIGETVSGFGSRVLGAGRNVLGASESGGLLSRAAGLGRSALGAGGRAIGTIGEVGATAMRAGGGLFSKAAEAGGGLLSKVAEAGGGLMTRATPMLGTAGRFLGHIAAPLAAVGAVTEGSKEDSTDRYARRFGTDTSDLGDGSMGSMAKFLALRAGGAATDIAQTLDPSSLWNDSGNSWTDRILADRREDAGEKGGLLDGTGIDTALGTTMAAVLSPFSKDARDALKNDFGPKLEEVGDRIQKGAEAFGTSVKTGVAEFGDNLEKGISNLGGMFSGAWSSAKAALNQGVEKVGNVASSVGSGVRNVATAVGDTASATVGAVQKGYQERGVAGVIDQGTRTAKRGMGDIGASVKQAAGDIKGTYNADTETQKKALVAEMEKSGMSKNAQAALMGNIAVESGFNAKSENMNYAGSSNERIRGIFKSKTKGMSDDELTALKQDPKAFGDKMYGDMGGYDFRGRGHIQLTGKDNYAKYSQQIYGDDRLVKNPELANDPEVSAKLAVAYTKDRTENVARKSGKALNDMSLDEASRATTQAIAGEGNNINKGYLKEVADKKLAAANKYAANPTQVDAVKKPVELAKADSSKPQPVTPSSTTTTQLPTQVATTAPEVLSTRKEAFPKVSTAAAEESKKVVVANAEDMKQAPAPTAAPTSDKQQASNNQPDLSSIPVVINDLGLVLINLGHV